MNLESALQIWYKTYLGTELYFIYLLSYLDHSSWSGTEPMPPAMEVQSVNHWTTREVSRVLNCRLICVIGPVICCRAAIRKDFRLSARVAGSRLLQLVTPEDCFHCYCQAPLSVGFSRQEYGSGLPFPSPGDISDPGIEPQSLASAACTGRFFSTSATWEAGGV